jgi:4-amino-4-deoxy-L-arabinose transferase-like glycosyltransferase
VEVTGVLDGVMSRISFLVVLIACLLCFPWLDRSFSSRGEPREALVAQSMLMTGNWISPLAYDGAVPSKPPFCHWLMSIASIPGGQVTEVTCRLPSAIAFVIFMYMFFMFVARRTSTERATVASLILLTSFEWLKSASSCRVDTILATSMAGALMALYRWEERERRGFPLIAALLIAVATLTKGPVGVVLPLGIWALYSLSRDSVTARGFFRICRDGLMIALPVVCVASLWYIAGYYERGDEFLAKIRYENLERFTSTMEDEPHKHSALYLLGMLILGLLPWSLMWIVALAFRWRECLAYIRSPRRAWLEAGELQRFSLVAVSAIVLFFCIPSSKRSVYLLPAYPFIALVAAASVQRWSGSTERMLRILTKSAKGLCVIPVLIAVTLWVYPSIFGLPDMRASIWAALTCLKLLIVGVALVILSWPLRAPAQAVMRTSVGAFAMSLSALVVSINLFILDGVMYHISPKRWVSSAEFVQSVEPTRRERFYSFGSEMYATSFYLEKPFTRAVDAVGPHSLVVLEARNLAKLQTKLGVETRELSRFVPGIDNRKNDLVVVEIGSLGQQ